MEGILQKVLNLLNGITLILGNSNLAKVVEYMEYSFYISIVIVLLGLLGFFGWVKKSTPLIKAVGAASLFSIFPAWFVIGEMGLIGLLGVILIVSIVINRQSPDTKDRNFFLSSTVAGFSVSLTSIAIAYFYFKNTDYISRLEPSIYGIYGLIPFMVFMVSFLVFSRKERVKENSSQKPEKQEKQRKKNRKFAEKTETEALATPEAVTLSESEDMMSLEELFNRGVDEPKVGFFRKQTVNENSMEPKIDIPSFEETSGELKTEPKGFSAQYTTREENHSFEVKPIEGVQGISQSKNSFFSDSFEYEPVYVDYSSVLPESEDVAQSISVSEEQTVTEEVVPDPEEIENRTNEITDVESAQLLQPEILNGLSQNVAQEELFGKLSDTKLFDNMADEIALKLDELETSEPIQEDRDMLSPINSEDDMSEEISEALQAFETMTQEIEDADEIVSVESLDQSADMEDAIEDEDTDQDLYDLARLFAEEIGEDSEQISSKQEEFEQESVEAISAIFQSEETKEDIPSLQVEETFEELSDLIVETSEFEESISGEETFVSEKINEELFESAQSIESELDRAIDEQEELLSEISFDESDYPEEEISLEQDQEEIIRIDDPYVMRENERKPDLLLEKEEMEALFAQAIEEFNTTLSGEIDQKEVSSDTFLIESEELSAGSIDDIDNEVQEHTEAEDLAQKAEQEEVSQAEDHLMTSEEEFEELISAIENMDTVQVSKNQHDNIIDYSYVFAQAGGRAAAMDSAAYLGHTINYDVTKISDFVGRFSSPSLNIEPFKSELPVMMMDESDQVLDSRDESIVADEFENQESSEMLQDEIIVPTQDPTEEVVTTSVSDENAEEEIVLSEDHSEPVKENLPVHETFEETVQKAEFPKENVGESVLRTVRTKQYSTKGLPKFVEAVGTPEFTQENLSENVEKVIAGAPKFISMSSVPLFVSQAAPVAEAESLLSEAAKAEIARDSKENVPTLACPTENIEADVPKAEISAEDIQPEIISYAKEDDSSETPFSETIVEDAAMKEMSEGESPQVDMKEKVESVEAVMKEEVKAEAIEEIQEDKIKEMPIRELAYEPKVGNASPKFMQLPGVPKFMKEEEVVESVFTEPTDTSESIGPMSDNELQLSDEQKKDLAATAQYTKEELGLNREADPNESQEMGIFCNEQEEYYRSQYYFLKSQVDFYKRQKGYYQKQLSVSENQMEFYAQQAEMYLQQADFYRTKKDED